jgi:SpoIID/LytB domain protein
MDGSIAIRWPARLPQGRSRAIFLLVACGAFILIGLNTIAFRWGASRGSAAFIHEAITSLGSAASATASHQPPVRVLLLDQVRQASVAIDQPFRMIDVQDGSELLDSGPLDHLSIRFTSDSIRLVELNRDIRVHAIDLVPAAAARFRVMTSKGPRYYGGSLRLMSQSGSQGSVINVVDMETYLLGVVPAEAPGGFHEQTMRTQAIIARTYAWYGALTSGAARDWDVLATEGSQMYVGLPLRIGAAERAVYDTRGIVCTWNSPQGERVFCTYYSSTCGGCTQDAGPVKNETSIPPLAGGIRCEHCRSSPFYQWEPVRLEKSIITQRLRDKYPAFRNLGRIETMEKIEATPEGRPVRFALGDADGRKIELEAENFRF